MRYYVYYPPELYHHGVKGMKWGVRRYQNYDGTRIGANKKSTNKALSNEKVFDPNRKKGGLGRTAKEEREIFRQKVLKDTAAYDYSKIEKSREEFNKLASELGSDYPKAYEQMLNDKSNREKLYEDTVSYLEKEFKTDRNDSDFYAYVSGDEDWLREGINEAIDKNIPKSVLDKTDRMFKAGDTFFDESRKISDSIANKYGDVTLRDVEVSKTSEGYVWDVSDKKGAVANGKDVAEYYLNSGDDRSWEAYQYKHFNDYWVQDVDQRYDLEDALYEEFTNRERKRFGITKVVDDR